MSLPVRSFVRRLVAAIAAPLVLLGLAFLGFELWHDRSLMLQDLRAATEAAAREVDAHLAQQQAALSLLAASPRLAPGGDLAAFHREAAVYHAIFGSHVVVADANLRMLLHTRVREGEPVPPLPVPVPEAEAVIKKARQSARPAIGDAFVGPVFGQWLVALAAPVAEMARAGVAGATKAAAEPHPAADGAPSVVITVVRLETLSGWLPEARAGQTAAIRLRDGRGALLASRGGAGEPVVSALGTEVGSGSGLSSGVGVGTAPQARHIALTVPLAQAPGWTMTLEPNAGAGWKALGAPVALLGLGWLLASASAWVAGRRFGRILSAEMSDLVAGTAGGAPPARLEEVARARLRLDALQSERDTHLRALQASRQELQRLLAEQGRIQEQERRRIARELHDDLQQRLALAATQAQALAADARVPTEPAARLTEGLREAVAASRRVIADLRPRVLEDLGLGAALQALAEQAEESAGFVCEALVVDDADDAELTPAQALTLYRVAQEALNNVRKHAQADTVTLSLGRTAQGGWRLVVEDDGCGFDVGERPAPTAFGLIGMRERVQAEGGHWQIHSAPGRGTTLVATLPASGVVVAHH